MYEMEVQKIFQHSRPLPVSSLKHLFSMMQSVLQGTTTAYPTVQFFYEVPTFDSHVLCTQTLLSLSVINHHVLTFGNGIIAYYLFSFCCFPILHIIEVKPTCRTISAKILDM